MGPSEKKDGIAMPLESALRERLDEVPLDDEKQNVLDAVRAKFVDLLDEVEDLLPDSREKSLVVTNVEQAFLWAEQTVRRNDIP